jgi:hypothetical protein
LRGRDDFLDEISKKLNLENQGEGELYIIYPSLGIAKLILR